MCVPAASWYCCHTTHLACLHRFDAGSVVFLLMYELYTLGVPFKTLFAGLAGLSVCLHLVMAVLWTVNGNGNPSKGVSKTTVTALREGMSPLITRRHRSSSSQGSSESGGVTRLHGLSFWEQLRTPEYLYVL